LLILFVENAFTNCGGYFVILSAAPCLRILKALYYVPIIAPLVLTLLAKMAISRPKKEKPHVKAS
jgi:hypothetical protein